MYLVNHTKGLPGEAIGVPDGCRCVFVRLALFNRWLQTLRSGPNQLDVDAADLLAFMLLHELGHITAGEHNVAFKYGALVQLNVDPSLAKASEKRADQHAATILRRSIYAKPFGGEASLLATQVSIALTTLSWNLEVFRLQEYMGSSLIGTPEVYFDSGYTHPNLAWRVFSANHLIHQTAETKALLDGFERSRNLGDNRTPLYKAQPE